MIQPPSVAAVAAVTTRQEAGDLAGSAIVRAVPVVVVHTTKFMANGYDPAYNNQQRFVMGSVIPSVQTR
jgi:hypothetical protein